VLPAHRRAREWPDRFRRPSRALSDERLRQIYGAASDELILPREEPAAGSEPPPITPAYAFS
jgi:hypothetical protein